MTLDQLKRSIITGLEARHRKAERDIHSYYLKQELDCCQQLNDMRTEYVGGPHYR